jgi:transketolase
LEHIDGNSCAVMRIQQKSAPTSMDALLHFNFGYIPGRNATDIPLSALAQKRQNALSSGAAAKKAKPSPMSPEEERCVNYIRVLSADMVQQANSGHPGAAMGCAPIAHVLWSKVMNYNPADPSWPNRDRFVLSNGHACALLYSMLHLTGYDLSLDDLKAFRQMHSRTPGHPENDVTPGVEVATGPLGQGLTNAVGIALGQAHAAATFNRDGFEVVNHCTFVICGDGCLQEGVTSEASSLAGHLGLGGLIVLYDDNNITIDGNTELSFTEDVAKRYEAYGWQVLVIEDGDTDLAGLAEAIAAAKAETAKPTLIKVRTTIGFGSDKAGTAGVHGAPLGHADLARVKKAYGFEEDKYFEVPRDVSSAYAACRTAGIAKHAAWTAMFERYRNAHPEIAAEFERRQRGELPQGWKAALPTWTPEDKGLATRQSSQQVLNKLAEAIPELVGGSADLTPSNLTKFKGALDFQKATPEGRYIRFGVREHAMAAVCNGLFTYGGMRPFCATFLNFCGYALGAMRVSALSKFGVIYIATHDSIGLGEDGPTHQPVELLCNFRATPGMLTIRPADANEVSGAYMVALERRDTPCVIALSRQGCNNLHGSSKEAVERGAYVLQPGHEGDPPPQLVLVGTGSEVQLIIQAAAALQERARVRVVSMPCWELFDEQPMEYRLSVFPRGVPVLAVEALSPEGWSKYAHSVVGMRTFGHSGPAKEVQKLFGFTTENVQSKALELLEFYKAREAPCLFERPDAP